MEVGLPETQSLASSHTPCRLRVQHDHPATLQTFIVAEPIDVPFRVTIRYCRSDDRVSEAPVYEDNPFRCLRVHLRDHCRQSNSVRLSSPF